MTDTFISELKKISTEVKRMADAIDKTELCLDKATIVFDAVCAEHISKKMDWLRDVLISNDIERRKEQIKANFKTFVYDLTLKDTQKLDEFILPN